MHVAQTVDLGIIYVRELWEPRCDDVSEHRSEERGGQWPEQRDPFLVKDQLERQNSEKEDEETESP